MKITSFEDGLVWEKAQILATDLKELFYKHQDYNFRDQIMRAAMSVSNNIAE